MADGSPNTLTLGNGVTQTIGKNNRLQVQSMQVSNPFKPFNSQPFLSHTYCYYSIDCSSIVGPNNGNILGIVDTLNPAKSQGFGYDALNRLTSFSLNGVLNQAFGIDSFGNMSPLASSDNGMSSTNPPLYTFDPATNRINNLPCASSVTPYDAAGNQLCSTDQYNQISLYSYDMEGRISQINALNNVNPAAWYTYGADGARVRKDKADGTSTEYVNFGGQTIAERDEVHQWTDYIYAGGKKIAKIPGEERWMGLLSNPPSQPTTLSSTIAANLNYMVKAKDQMCYRQFTADNDASGLSLSFSNGVTSDATWITSDEQPLGAQTSIEDGWTHRCIDLTHGNTTTNSLLSGVNLVAASTGNGFYTFLVDMSIISQDGSVTPIFGTPGAPVILSGDPNPPSLWTGIATPWMFGSGNEGEATHFYVYDHLGTAQLELASGGWTIYSGQFAPYGQEIDALTNGDHYKFTGKERDTESGLDYFGARYYGSSMGRFMSPDSYGGRLADPQSLNKYAYARNNPLIYVDPDGHDFNLTGCGTTNTATCNNNMVGTTSTDGKNTFTATVISNGANGLQDQAGNAYSGTVTSAGVSFSQNGSNTSYGGSWINGSNDTSFSQSGGALNGFSFNFTQPNTSTGQTLAGTFSYGDNMSASQAGKALEAAGFSHSYLDAFVPFHGYDVTHYRGGGDPKTGAGAAHFILDDPYKVDDGFVMGPVRAGDFHFGETDPRIDLIHHVIHDVIPAYTKPH